MKGFVTAFFVFLIYFTANGQGEANVWCFGDHIGLDFNAASPEIFSTGMYQFEGSASICDSEGNLLFYSDGLDLFNGENKEVFVYNEQLFTGHFSSTQSALFVQAPGYPDNYYLFTADAGYYIVSSTLSVSYTLLNKCDANPTSGFTFNEDNKSILLIENSPERLTAVNHYNGSDIWVATYHTKKNTLNAFLITEEGVSTTPVASYGGELLYDRDNINSAVGSLKFNSTGTKAALAINLEGVVVYDFNNQTGHFSNPLHFKLFSPYGIEFSQDGRWLYVSSAYGGELFQYDLQKSTTQGLKDSEKVIYKMEDYNIGQNKYFGALQLGPDNKLYLSSLQSVQNPNAPASEIIFDSTRFAMENKTTWGLPNFNSSYFDPAPFIIYNADCGGNNVQFSLGNNENVESVEWHFGEEGGGNSSDITPSYEYSSYGIHDVEAHIVMDDGKSLTKRKRVFTKEFRADYITDRRGICSSEGVEIDASAYYGKCIGWSTGSDEFKQVVHEPGWYWIDIFMEGCVKRDSFYVDFQNEPTITKSTDYLCADESIILKSSYGNAKEYLWSTGDTTTQIEVKKPGKYWVESFINYCTNTDTFNIINQRYPEFHIPIDTTICEGGQLNIQLDDMEADYFWSNETTGNSGVFTAPGTYWVSSEINGCVRSDTFKVEEISSPDKLFFEHLMCENQEYELSFPVLEGNFLWSTNETSPSIKIVDEGMYTLEVSNKCYAEEVIFEVEDENCDCGIFIPNVITPNGDGKNDQFYPVLHQNIKSLKLSIYNRSGRLIYSSEGLESQWTGLNSGVLQPSGVYYYLIEYNCIGKDKGVELYRQNGTLHLFY